jgi:hypothetical protein
MTIRVFGLPRRATTGLSVLASGALVGALLVAASPGSASAAGCATVGSQVTCTFSYNGTNGSDGTAQNFVVPAGVPSVTVEAWGAQGGGNDASHGLGGHVKGTVTVTPAQTLTVRVGGQPASLADPPLPGGYNGGGNGGGFPSDGGGGGASDVRQGGDALADRIIVAGGGGGIAANGPSAVSFGGAGGGISGGSGMNCAGVGGCSGGGPAQGGAGGAAACSPLGGTTANGGSGSLGVGGNGASVSCDETEGAEVLFGGGGGGGLFGGGGGSATIFAFDGSAGGGGGGSGFVVSSATGQTNQAGVRSGNGAVTITYTAPALPGNIFATTFVRCTTLHVGYNRFVNGTVVHWTVTTNGVGTVASGQFTAIGGGNLGSKTYHFLDITLGTKLKPEPAQSHVLLTWANGGRFDATRDPGC